LIFFSVLPFFFFWNCREAGEFFFILGASLTARLRRLSYLPNDSFSLSQATPTDATEIEWFSAPSELSVVGLLLTVPRIDHRMLREHREEKNWVIVP
jgi:hypothetical protein